MNKSQEKFFWMLSLFISLALLFIAIMYKNTVAGILSFIIAIIVNRKGKDVILEDYNKIIEKKFKQMKKEKIINEK